MIDIEKLDNLPFKENKSANLTRRYGNVYNVLDYRRTSDKMKSPYNISEIILKANIGKSFDMAFHYYCTKVDKQHQHIFLDNFNIQRRWRNYGYYIDEQGNIQNTPYKKYKAPVVITSADYKTELRHKVTGDKRSLFREIWTKNLITKEWKDSLGIKHSYSYKEKHKFLGLEYSKDGDLPLPVGLRYMAKESDFEPVCISGWIKYFDSKQNQEFQRYHAELRKRKSISDGEKEKIKLENEMALLSLTGGRFTKREKLKEERKAQKESEKKAREETKQILQRKGFRPNAFTSAI